MLMLSRCSCKARHMMRMICCFMVAHIGTGLRNSVRSQFAEVHPLSIR